MKIEFKFRAFHIPTKRIFDVYSLGKHIIFEDSMDGVGTSPTLPAEAEDCILMQFTGLKDIHGKEIYEGDVLEFMHHKHRVFRVKGGLVINSHSDDFDKDYTPFYEACADMQTAQWMEQCTITGNIYENHSNKS